MHGGKTPSGIASPQTRHGRYSRSLPTRLAERYQEAAADPELLALREDVALLDTRLSDLLSRVDSGESGQRWRDVAKAFSGLSAAIIAGEPDGITRAMHPLSALIDAGVSDAEAWAEVMAALEQRRKLVESEQKRLVAMQQMVSAEQAMLLVTAIVETVRSHVQDRITLAAISADIERLAAQAGG